MKVLSVFGTRPEAIKLAPVVRCLEATEGVEHIVCVSGQHREMLDQVLTAFGLRPQYDLHTMRHTQGLEHITQAVLEGVGSVLRQERPDWIVVQGDTTTSFAAALAGFYAHVRVAHVEAGLRTGNPNSPWPEEVNRRMIAAIAEIHFAPTPAAAANLRAENVAAERIIVTGNTVIDALLWTARQPHGHTQLQLHLTREAPGLSGTRRIVLVTLHRRENQGERLHDICVGLARLAARGDIDLVIPLHLNPVVRKTVHSVLGSTPHVHLIEPLDYLPFVALLQRCHLVITDSGGIQEEAPSLGKPVIVARDTTERPEAIAAGTAILAGPGGDAVEKWASVLLDDADRYAAMATAANPFGDGHAAERIVAALQAVR